MKGEQAGKGKRSKRKTESYLGDVVFDLEERLAPERSISLVWTITREIIPCYNFRVMLVEPCVISLTAFLVLTFRGLARAMDSERR